MLVGVVPEQNPLVLWDVVDSGPHDVHYILEVTAGVMMNESLLTVCRVEDHLG